MQDKKIESHTVFFTSVRALLFVTPKLWLASSLTAPVLNILGILLYCLFVMHLKPLYCSHIFSKEIVVGGVFFFLNCVIKKINMPFSPFFPHRCTNTQSLCTVIKHAVHRMMYCSCFSCEYIFFVTLFAVSPGKLLQMLQTVWKKQCC